MLARLLIEDGADIHAKDDNGQSALHQAALNGEETLVRLLIERGADIHAKDTNKQSALQLAMTRGHRHITQLLLRHSRNILAEGRELEALIMAAVDKAAVDLAAANQHSNNCAQTTRSGPTPTNVSTLKLKDSRRGDRLDLLRKMRERSGYIPTEDDKVPDFARRFAETIPHDLMPQRPNSSRLCSHCSNIHIRWLLQSPAREQTLFHNFFELHQSARNCELCRMILSSIKKFENSAVREINIAVAPQFLIVEVLDGQPDSYGFLRLCADSGK
jgi:hypothetical protein